MVKYIKNNFTRMAESTQLFPIPNQAYLDALMEFGSYADDELEMIEASNEAIPPENNASLFVLQLNMRPGLKRGNTDIDDMRRHAYKVGVLLGRRIIKGLIEIDDGGDFVIMTDEQRQVVSDSIQQNRYNEFIPQQENNVLGALDGRVHAKDPEHGFYPYLDANGEELYRYLRTVWQQAEMPFYIDEQAKRAAGDQVPQGMKDIFRLFAFLEDSQPRNWTVRSRENDDSKDHDEQAFENSPLSEHIKFLRGEDNTLSDEEKQRFIGSFRESYELHENMLHSERIARLAGKTILPLAISGVPLSVGGSFLMHGGDIVTAVALTASTAAGAGIAMKFRHHIKRFALNLISRRGTV